MIRRCDVALRCLLPLAAALIAPAHLLAEIAIDADFPGGNIVVERIDGAAVTLHPELRDTAGNWFYWALRVRGAAGQTLTFNFSQQSPVGVRGVAVSLDEGATWSWLGRDRATNSSFTYAFPADANSVRFSFGMPYTQANLEAFLKRIGANPAMRVDTLAVTRKKRNVERIHLGRLDGAPAYRVLLTARHHCCEMMASYAIEGIMESALADDDLGRWYRDRVEIAAVPFVDKDGVEDGDQGKNRKPRDHNRDYSGDSVHVETAALRQFVPQWLAGKPFVAIDIHCPSIRGGGNEKIHQPGKRDPAAWQQQQHLAKLLKQFNRGPLPYDPADDLPFGKGWNTAGNFSQGDSSSTWAGKLPGVKLATTFELPYANASGKEVNQQTAKAFGHDLAAAIKAYLEEQP